MRLWLALSCVLAALIVPAASTLTGPAVIDITQTQIRHSGSQDGVFADELWVYHLHNQRITIAAIGYSTLRCEFYGSGGSLGAGVSDCVAIYAFARGKIIARGVVKDRAYYALAILGGTGIYSNVGGQVLVTTIGSRPHEERLLFGLEV